MLIKLNKLPFNIIILLTAIGVLTRRKDDDGNVHFGRWQIPLTRFKPPDRLLEREEILVTKWLDRKPVEDLAKEKDARTTTFWVVESTELKWTPSNCCCWRNFLSDLSFQISSGSLSVCVCVFFFVAFWIKRKNLEDDSHCKIHGNRDSTDDNERSRVVRTNTTIRLITQDNGFS